MSRNPLRSKGFRDFFLSPNRCRFNKKNPKSGIIESPQTITPERSLVMCLTEIKLEINSRIRIDFGRGNLSSDGGLLLMKEFLSKIGFERLAAAKFKTTDSVISPSIC